MSKKDVPAGSIRHRGHSLQKEVRGQLSGRIEIFTSEGVFISCRDEQEAHKRETKQTLHAD